MAPPPFSLADFIDSGSASLYNITQEISIWLWPRANQDPGATIALFDGGKKANLTFDDTGQNLVLAFPIFTQLLAKDKTLVEIICAYPLSGQYDHLPRFLFYACIVFAILLRHRRWIAEIALGVVMTYSATCCIHLFVLLGYYNFGLSSNPDDPPSNHEDSTPFGEVDFWGIAPVVATSAIMLIPVFHWSSLYQWNKGRIVLMVWSLLIIVTFGVVVAFSFGWGYWWAINIVPSVAICSKECDSISYSQGTAVLGLSTIEQYLGKCDCTDFCGLLSPHAPLRQKQGMVALLPYRKAQRIVCKDPSCFDPNYAAGWFQRAVFILWAVAFGQSILALLCVNSSTEAVRNRIFRIMNAGRRDVIIALFKGNRQRHLLDRFGLASAHGSSKLHRRIRRAFACFVAGLFYGLALFGLITSPVLFLLSIVLGELFLGTISTSERSDAIGSWGPWVAAGLVLIATFVTKYHKTIVKTIARRWRHFWWLVQYDSGERKDKLREDAYDADAIDKTVVFKSMIKGVGLHCWYIAKKSWWNVMLRIKAFIEWLKDPQSMSEKQYGELISEGDPTTRTFHGYPLSKYKMPPICTCQYFSHESHPDESESEADDHKPQRNLNGHDSVYIP